ncbi:helix-turn-helix domain-containing protein [Agitococcus lubricus]|uniref:Uncharacterized protein DUF4115 n=1 Tax=Agitococcus lubricus TaxID=1077255 RepID=A0A2T5J2S8_9GAMM|nr:RodZ domain-containing protein [Agitococcus lubricus]PTQ90831.1 uncharacterized protein DUF4115 [Agitococcus lubricus]
MEHQSSKTAINQSAYLAFRPGARLKQAREQQGLTVADVCQTLKILPRIIEQLEADDYAALPEAVFIRGYLRQYAQLLSLPVEDMLARFDEYYVADRGQPPSRSPREHIPFPKLPQHITKPAPRVKWARPHKKIPLKPIVIIFSLVLLISVLSQSNTLMARLNYAWQQAQRSTASPVPAVMSENTISLPNTTTTAQAIDTLDLRFRETSLVVIRDASGKELANGHKKAGDSLVVTGESPFSIELSQASAVEFRFNDKTIDLKPYTVNGAVNFRLSR